MEIKKIISILFIALASSSIFAGGGWPKEKGSYYLKLASWWISANENFSELGNKNSLLPEAGLFNVNIYGEYGITNRLTVTAYIPFFSRSYENKLFADGVLQEDFPGRDQNTFGDSEIGVKYGLLKKGKFSWTASLILGLPLGNSDTGLTEALPTGDGEFNQIIRTDLGVSLYNSDSLSLYGNIYGGINIRSKDFSEELRGGIEIGAGMLNNKLWIITKLDTIQALNNGDRNFENSSGLFANNIEVTNFSPEVAYYFSKKIGLSASASFPLSGKLVYANPAYSFGVFLDIN